MYRHNGSASSEPFEKHGSERRQSDGKRMAAAMQRNRCCVGPAEIALPAATILRCVRIEQFLPESARRNADTVIRSHDRTKVAHDYDLPPTTRFAEEGQNVLFCVVRVDPFKAGHCTGIRKEWHSTRP